MIDWRRWLVVALCFAACGTNNRSLAGPAPHAVVDVAGPALTDADDAAADTPDAVDEDTAMPGSKLREVAGALELTVPQGAFAYSAKKVPCDPPKPVTPDPYVPSRAPYHPKPARAHIELEPDIAPPPRRQSIGTSKGEKIYSHIGHASFNSADQPFAVAALYYNDWPTLAAHFDADAGAEGPPKYLEFSALDGGVHIWLTDDQGRHFGGIREDRRPYVIGEMGARYMIGIRNKTSHRLMVVVTVDGIDILTQKAGRVDSRYGYVFPAAFTDVIVGFRDDEDTVSAFRFGSSEQAFANTTPAGKGGKNIGVIGFAFYVERNDCLEDATPVHRIARSFSSTEVPNPFPDSPSEASSP